jgi:hypothetical protein
MYAQISFVKRGEINTEDKHMQIKNVLFNGLHHIWKPGRDKMHTCRAFIVVMKKARVII